MAHIRNKAGNQYWAVKAAEEHFTGDKPKRLAWVAEHSAATEWEITYHPEDGHKASFKHVATGHYLCAEAHGLLGHQKIHCDRGAVGGWETFILESLVQQAYEGGAVVSQSGLFGQ